LVFITEEKLLSKFYCHPLEIVGIEGVTGLTLSTIGLIVLQFIKCAPVYTDELHKEASFCPYSKIEDSKKYIFLIQAYK